MPVNKKLVVIDGKSVFYRGYYAMPNLATKDGTPTGGVFGFAVMAIEVLKKFKPDYVVVAWDKPKTNIRRRVAIYPEYKANRKPAPPDFYVQIPVLHELLRALKWPLFEIDDHEADDIMATLAKQAHAKHVDTLLITSDQDVLQLVNPHTQVALLKKGLTNVELMNEQKIQERVGLSPQQYIDYKALKGDSSDNIPGVPGVGDKTAQKLIADYRSLDGVYQNLDKITGSLHKKLVDGKASALMTRDLVILDEDVPINLKLEDANAHLIDAEEFSELLKRLEFRTLLRQLPPELAEQVASRQTPSEVSAPGSLRPTEHKFGQGEVVFSKDDLKKLKLEPKQGLVIHTRTVGPNFTELSHVILSDSLKRSVLIDLTGQLEAKVVAEHLKSLLEDTKVPKIGFRLKRAMHAFLHYDVTIEPVGHDVQVGAFLLNALLREMTLTALADNIGYEGPDLDELAPMDVQAQAPAISSVVWQLYEQQAKDLKALPKLDKLAKEIEFPVIGVLAAMEHRGIKLDSSVLAKMALTLEDQISDIEQQIYGHAGKEFNISSPIQLAQILYEELKLPTAGVKKGKSGYSTAVTELDKLRALHPIINLISDYREHTKLKNTYVDTLPKLVDENNRLHTDFSLVTAPTGRLSSSDPNLQNIPVRTDLGKRIREAFVASSGNMLISADYSQFELRLAAVLAGDDDLIEAFNGGLDIHTRTASQIYGVAMDDVTKRQRRDAKVVNFGVLYGMSPHGLSVATGMTRDEAKEFIDRYFELRKPLLKWVEKTRKAAEEQGYVETMFGRRRPTPDVKSPNFMVREAAYRQAVNMPVQGTEADLMKMAMIKIEEELAGEGEQVLQIHDSILVEAPEWKAKKVAKEMKDIMENIYKLPVALDVDISIGKNWGEL